MNDTIILCLCIILFVVAHKLIRRTALRHIKESNNADESCYYKQSTLFIGRTKGAIY